MPTNQPTCEALYALWTQPAEWATDNTIQLTTRGVLCTCTTVHTQKHALAAFGSRPACLSQDAIEARTPCIPCNLSFCPSCSITRYKTPELFKHYLPFLCGCYVTRHTHVAHPKGSDCVPIWVNTLTVGAEKLRCWGHGKPRDPPNAGESCGDTEHGILDRLGA